MFLFWMISSKLKSMFLLEETQLNSGILGLEVMVVITNTASVRVRLKNQGAQEFLPQNYSEELRTYQEPENETGILTRQRAGKGLWIKLRKENCFYCVQIILYYFLRFVLYNITRPVRLTFKVRACSRPLTISRNPYVVLAEFLSSKPDEKWRMMRATTISGCTVIP